MDAAWHFMVHNGAAGAAVFVFVSAVVGGLLHAILRTLRRVANLLDTHLPGGLRDVLEALEGDEDRHDG